MSQDKRKLPEPKAWTAIYKGSSELSKFSFIIPGIWRPEEFLRRIKKDIDLLFVRLAAPVETLFATDYISEHTDDEFIEDQARAFEASQSLEG